MNRRKNKFKEGLKIKLAQFFFTIIISSIIFLIIKLPNHLIQKDNLSVHFIDVGQGDCTFIKSPTGENILIDSGDNYASDKVLSYLDSYSVRKIDILIATHPDTDHIGAMDDVIYNYNVGSIFMPDIASESVNYFNLLDAIDYKNKIESPLYAGDIFEFKNGMILEILSPIEGKIYRDTNSNSIVAKLTYEDTSFIFTGDSTIENEMDMMRKNFDLSCDVLKLGHHGSITSSSIEFLKETSPSMAVVSSGRNNDYGHPNDEVIESLENLKIPYVNTAYYGDIIFISDGKKVSLLKNDRDLLEILDEKFKNLILEFKLPSVN